jgi:hypothetical protein
MSDHDRFEAHSLEIRIYCEDDEAEVIDLWKRCGLLRPWNDPAKDIRRKRRVNPEWFLCGSRTDHWDNHDRIRGSSWLD